MLEKRFHRLVTVDEMQFGLMPMRGRINAVFIMRRIEEEHHANGNKVVCV